MRTLWQDLRYGLRMLVKKPGFALAAALTLALGIGVNTAIFSVVNAVLLRPLPYPEPERLMQLWETNERFGLREPISPHEFAAWREQSQTFEQMAAYEYAGFALTSEGSQPERIVGSAASASLFAALGVKPALGRDFLAEEDAPGRNRVVILSHGLWQRRFGADPELIGQTLTLNRESYTVIGVMPPGFQFPDSVEMWTPLGVDLNSQSRSNHYLRAVGRLKPDTSLETAQAEMNSIVSAVAREHPDSTHGARLVSLHEEIVGNVRPALYVLLGSVALILLIACANVANLLLARATARQKEVAIRAALGANRRRLIRQFLTESILLAALGGGLGLLLALWGVDLLVAASPGDIPRVDKISIDGTVLGFTFGVALLTGIVMGCAPALRATKLDLNETLKEGSHSATGGPRRQRLSGLLVIAEVALALVLLIGAGLLLQSFMRLLQVDPGFRPENLLTMQLSLPEAAYPEAQHRIAFFDQVLARIEALAGVQAVGAVSDLPFSGSRTSNSFEIEARPPMARGESINADFRISSPNYFQAMGIPLLRGRDFSARDTRDAPLVVIINQTMARRFWPDEDPMGQRLTIGRAADGSPVWREVVGIIGDIRHDRLNVEPAPEMYVPYWQRPAGRLSLVVRATGEPRDLIAAIRSAVQSVDPHQPVYSINLMERRIARFLAPHRFNAYLLGIFALLALLLAVVGVYGVLAYAVARRTQEIGIRMALGARPRDVLRLVIKQGLSLTLIGIAIGLAASLALTRLLTSLLYGVSATDPLTFMSVPLLLLAVALLATYIPARRAARVDPLVALRYE